MNKLIKPLAFLIVLILICSIIARVATDSETLYEYGEKNPEIAYATSKPSETPVKENIPVNSPVPEPTVFPSSDPDPVPSPDPFDPSGALLTEESEESTHYTEGFFYQPLTDPVIKDITGISYPVSETIAPALAKTAVNVIPENEIDNLAISYDALRYMQVLYYDFNGEVKTGELICNKGIADDLVEIFYELYQNEYRIESIRLIDAFDGDDTLSMEHNNTSCFNYRVVDGTDSLSKHALGCAIDINPFYNPYIVFDKNGIGNDYISPKGSEIYVDRSQNFPYKIDENDLCYKLFKEHGFTWGGDWNSCKDYQHFQKTVE